MKYFLILAFALSFIVPVNAQNDSKSSTTVYYLIRHAEKDRSDKSNRNPNLTETGKVRAENWSNIFKHVTFDAVYSTNYNRTMQTATPTAKAQKIEIQTYDPRSLSFEEFTEATKGKTVLVVGHSNTTPMFANAILGEQKYEFMDDNDNGRLFIVTVTENQKIDQILNIN
ncbi:phosphoglycerate mutase family protein [Psychroserpens sp. S379A]|uniref:phosphoglycerate mutase family protein n=1 Tax=Psychroserpens sp. S379A TaxID=3415137 RepID=UPI003C7E9C91